MLYQRYFKFTVLDTRFTVPGNLVGHRYVCPSSIFQQRNNANCIKEFNLCSMNHASVAKAAIQLLKIGKKRETQPAEMQLNIYNVIAYSFTITSYICSLEAVCTTVQNTSEKRKGGEHNLRVT